ncbi:uncharacterized protein G2W53_023948 [Senna tora]|uniref:Uncharacterized protein n=1 Tax=Senna tora TaxID=362788 RepID=A0A834WEZ6_9FABA|nr:uncharacterized protein G2W53_023948 [Senna tora]
MEWPTYSMFGIANLPIKLKTSDGGQF